MESFFLSPEVALDAPAGTAPDQHWLPVPESGSVRPALVLEGDVPLEVGHGLRVASGTTLFLRAGTASLASPTATLALELLADGHTHCLGEIAFTAPEPRDLWMDLTPWRGATGRLRLRPAATGGGGTTRLAIHELAIALQDDLPRVRARAFGAERTRNELAHFAHVYDHAIYHPGHGPAGTPVPCRELATLLATAPAGQGPRAAPAARPSPADLPPQMRDPYHYGHHLLGLALHAIPPDFPARLRRLAAAGPVRVLSLCSGAARIEAAFAAATADLDVHWTLMDLSPDLLASAAGNFPAGCVPDLVAGDLNRIADFGERYDVILCVSGLHHIVELESVVDFLRTALRDEGEFWSIGEAIGRNGNRLWPSDYAVANAFFRQLPERLRRNRATGAIDADLPDMDCSNATFEGIRSQDIEPLLHSRLEPVHLYRRNCFLWRLLDLAYADNYDMAAAGDVAWVHRAVDAELAHFRAGGRPTELHAVYRRPRD